MTQPIRHPGTDEWHVLLDDGNMLTWGHSDWGNVVSIIGAATVTDNVTSENDAVCFVTRQDAEVGIEILAEYTAFLDRIKAIRMLKRASHAG